MAGAAQTVRKARTVPVPRSSRLGSLLQRLWRGERNPWLAYEVAKTFFESGAWDGLSRRDMRRALARLTQGANPDTVTEGWRDFLLAHGYRLPKA